MAIITMPALVIAPEGVSIAQRRYEIGAASDPSGTSQVRLLGPPRWAIMLTSPASVLVADAATWQTTLLQLRGRINHLAAYDPARPAPRGTMRGTMTLSGSHSAGATSVVVTAGAGQASTTLLKGDWLQIGSGLTGQLLMVMADAIANGSGVITLTTEPPLRTGYAGGTAVTWDKARGHYKSAADESRWQYGTGQHRGTAQLLGGFSFDGLEQWT
jgi:hypothetical protein